ncbi:hypothetical protein BpHYR1_032795 [Brachionus plicatilis]|uniref:Uncharacterized protein n=1 Tax=Brachionus plicatilis TaxID=10195 RepID=A0A3M7STE7_BRAPC|nr:hypothetical protein BpHYR1_032795 [Brachionus plicatilis]
MFSISLILHSLNFYFHIIFLTILVIIIVFMNKEKCTVLNDTSTTDYKKSINFLIMKKLNNCNEIYLYLK